MKTTSLILILAAVVCVTFGGCAKKVDPNKPLDQVIKEAKTMSIPDLRSMAEAYVVAIKVQKNEVDRITDAMKGMSVKDIFGDKARPMKERLSKIQLTATALLERYQVYAAKLEERGGEVPKLQAE